MEDIRRGCKVILGKKHAKVPIPYRDEMAAEVKGKKLKFGYYLSGKLHVFMSYHLADYWTV